MRENKGCHTKQISKSVAAGIAVLMLSALLSGCGNTGNMLSDSGDDGNPVTSSEDSASYTGEIENVQDSASAMETTTAEDAEESSEVNSETEIIENEETEEMVVYVTIGEDTLIAKLENNSSSQALMDKLAEGNVTVNMHDYAGFEKVGSLGFNLPRNDRDYTTKSGDIILYQGNQLVFYYGRNSWDFTKLGEFQDVTADDLINIFGSGNITATLSLNNG